MMSTTWSLVTTGISWWAAGLIGAGALALTWWWQERHPGLLMLRALAALVMVALLIDPALSRTTKHDEPPPVAVVMDVSESMSVNDRHLPANHLLDLAEILHVIKPGMRSTGPRTMATALTIWHADLPAASAGSLPAARLRAHSTTLLAAASAGTGYRDAEKLCRDAAELAEEIAADLATERATERATEIAIRPPATDDTPRRTRLAAHGAAIAALLPHLTAEQAAGDAALIAGWRAAQDLESRMRVSAIDDILHTSRGQVAARLTREALIPQLSAHAEVSTWAMSEHLSPMTWSQMQVEAAGTDFAVLSDLARTWATGRTPGAVVLISDGRNHGGDPRPALRSLAARGAHVLTIAIGDEAPPDEPALLTLDGPSVVRAQATITLLADVRRSRDAESPWDLVIQVDGVIAQRLPLPTTGALRQVQRIELPAGASGLRQCAARLEPHPPGNPPTSQTNHPASAWHPCPVRVTDAPIRVLVAEALPRWETRALVAALEADPLCQVERRYLQGPGAVAAAIPATALAAADAVILGDLLPAELPADDQTRLAEFVADGGFLTVVAGPRGMPAAFPFGPLADLLPVVAQRGAPFWEKAPTRTSLSLTSSGDSHPISRLLPDSDLNRRLWSALPTPSWIAGGVIATADAEVLAEASNGPQAVLPVVAIRTIGVGRVLWLGAPETWRWRTFERGRAQIAFWHQALRWGLAGRPRGTDAALAVAVDPPRIDTRSTADLLITAPQDTPTAQVRTATGGLVTLTLHHAGHGRWRGVIADLPPGLQQILVTSGNLREERDLLVRPRSANELGDPTADPLALRALARDCGGEATTTADLPAAIQRLLSRLHPETVTTISTWRLSQGPWLALIAAALICTEWWWRKRSGMP